MAKQKTKKAFLKRLRITGSGKVLRRHQLAAGHLKRKKGKGALERQKKTVELFKGGSKGIKSLLGL